MSNTYWNNKGKHKEFVTLLQKLITSEGSVVEPKKNPALERFRIASNCYYDLYNNGLCNRAAEFRKVFKLAASRYRFKDVRGYWHFTDELYRLVEAKMDRIISDAVHEQEISADDLSFVI